MLWESFVDWVRSLPGKPVFFGGKGFSCVDIGYYAMAKLGATKRELNKSMTPREWFDPDAPHTHTHRAPHDAKEQDLLYCNMINNASTQ